MMKYIAAWAITAAGWLAFGFMVATTIMTA